MGNPCCLQSSARAESLFRLSLLTQTLDPSQQMTRGRQSREPATGVLGILAGLSAASCLLALLAMLDSVAFAHPMGRVGQY
jgi:hypothetical protein